MRVATRFPADGEYDGMRLVEIVEGRPVYGFAEHSEGAFFLEAEGASRHGSIPDWMTEFGGEFDEAGETCCSSSPGRP